MFVVRVLLGAKTNGGRSLITDSEILTDNLADRMLKKPGPVASCRAQSAKQAPDEAGRASA